MVFSGDSIGSNCTQNLRFATNIKTLSELVHYAIQISYSSSSWFYLATSLTEAWCQGVYIYHKLTVYFDFWSHTQNGFYICILV